MRGQRGAGRRRGRWRWRDRDRAVGKEEEREGARREREGGKEGEGKRKSENTETEEKTGERLDGKKPEGLQAGVDSRLGRAGLGLGDVSTGSAPCTRVGSWVWVHKPSRQKSAPLGNLPVCPRPSSPFGLCTRISSSTQGEYCSCPIRMRRNVSISPILPGSCQPHASSPGDKKGSLILSHSN